MKFPAYGAQLMAERRAGRHPIAIHVAISENIGTKPECDWFCDGSHPTLVVKGSEYFRVDIDWRCVAGSLVVVFDEVGWYVGDHRRLRAVVQDIARYAGPVWLKPAALPFFVAMVGPTILTEEIERVNGERRQKWIAAAERELAGREPALEQ